MKQVNAQTHSNVKDVIYEHSCKALNEAGQESFSTDSWSRRGQFSLNRSFYAGLAVYSQVYIGWTTLFYMDDKIFAVLANSGALCERQDPILAQCERNPADDPSVFSNFKWWAHSTSLFCAVFTFCQVKKSAQTASSIWRNSLRCVCILTNYSTTKLFNVKIVVQFITIVLWHTASVILGDSRW